MSDLSVNETVEEAAAAPPKPGRKLPSWTGWVVLAVILFLLPQLPEALMPNTRLDLFSKAIYLSVAALSIALLTGFNGQISIGHGAFLGFGAYTTVILVGDYNLPFLLAVAIGTLLSFVLGLIVGVPALRIKGVYLALVTLALATLFPQFLKRFDTVTGGSQGRGFGPRPAMADPDVPMRQQVARFRAPEWSGLNDQQWRYYVFLLLAVVAFVIVRNVVFSRVGRSLVAIRDNEVAAEVAGVDLARTKVTTFGLSAGLAGLAGGMYAILQLRVSPGAFQIPLSIEILVAAVIGGAASILGPVIGALILTFRTELPGGSGSWSQVILGALLIVFMLIAPGGFVGLWKQQRAKWRVRRMASAARAAAQSASAPASVEASDGEPKEQGQ